MCDLAGITFSLPCTDLAIIGVSALSIFISGVVVGLMIRLPLPPRRPGGLQ